jgi:hypothetical protein
MIERRCFKERAVASGGARGGRASVLEGLIATIGEAAALKLVDAFGGARVYVPQMPEPEDMLSGLIGIEAALQLARVYGGERLELPHPNGRRDKILSLRRSGLSVDRIALEAGCTRRRVFQILAEERQSQRRGMELGAAVDGGRLAPSDSGTRLG